MHLADATRLTILTQEIGERPSAIPDFALNECRNMTKKAQVTDHDGRPCRLGLISAAYGTAHGTRSIAFQGLHLRRSSLLRTEGWG